MSGSLSRGLTEFTAQNGIMHHPVRHPYPSFNIFQELYDFEHAEEEIRAQTQEQFEERYKRFPLATQWMLDTLPVSSQDPFAVGGRRAHQALRQSLRGLKCARSLTHISDLEALSLGLRSRILERLEVLHLKVRQEVNPSLLDTIWEGLTERSQVWALSIASCALGDEVLHAFGQRRLEQGIRWLDATRSSLGRDTRWSTWDAGHGPQLETLLAGQNPRLARCLPEFLSLPLYASLQALSLERCDLTTEAVSSVIDVSFSESLTCLSLRANALGDAGVLEWAQRVHTPHLHTLDLSECSLAGRCLPSVLGGKVWPSLRILDISENPLGQNLSWEMKRHDLGHSAQHGEATLREIRIVNTGLHDCDLEIVLALSTMRALRRLDLRANTLTDKSTAWLTSALPCPHMTHLNLAGNRISDLGGVALLTSPLRKTLQSLDLSDNPITDRIFALWRESRHPCLLEALGLRSMQLSERGIRDLLYCVDIGLCPRLRSVDLSHTRIWSTLDPKLLAAFGEAGVVLHSQTHVP